MIYHVIIYFRVLQTLAWNGKIHSKSKKRTYLYRFAVLNMEKLRHESSNYHFHFPNEEHLKPLCPKMAILTNENVGVRTDAPGTFAP